MRLEGERAHLFAEESTRIVLGARAPLLDDDLALGGDLLGIQEQVLHAVSLEIDHQVELLRRDRDVIGGDVLGCERVVLAAILLDELRELLGTVARRALEHQVLQEVSDAGRPPKLVARADAVPHLEGHDRAAWIFEQQHVQPVVERRGHDTVLAARAGRNEQRDDQ